MKKTIEVGEATNKSTQKEKLLPQRTVHGIARQEAIEQCQRDFKRLKEKLEKSLQKQPHNIKKTASLYINSAINNKKRRNNNYRRNNQSEIRNKNKTTNEKKRFTTIIITIAITTIITITIIIITIKITIRTTKLTTKLMIK